MKNKYMQLALNEAKKAFAQGEVPVGCVIVKDDKVIARAYNKKEKMKDVCAHAEILAIKKAEKKLNNWRLDNTIAYVTLEPCAMCLSALMQARVSKIYFAAQDKVTGACVSKIRLADINFSNPKIEIYGGIMEEESLELIKSFFQALREKNLN